MGGASSITVFVRIMQQPAVAPPSATFVASRREAPDRETAGYSSAQKYASGTSKLEARKGSLEAITSVTTFLAGFAMNDLSTTMDVEAFDDYEVTKVVYLGMMSFTVGCSFFCSVVGIMTLLA